MKLLKATTTGVILAILAGMVIMIRGCTVSNPNPDFDAFLSSFIGVTGSSQISAHTQRVSFLTDTVFPVSDNGNPDSQDIFDTAVVRFAGIRAQATKLSHVDVRDGEVGPSFLDINDDSSGSDVSDLINHWTVILPIFDNLKNASYLFIVTACTDQGKCQSTPDTLCLLDGKIIGHPGYHRALSDTALQSSSCHTPEWDNPDNGYSGFGSAGGVPHREAYTIPDDWAKPNGSFADPDKSN